MFGLLLHRSPVAVDGLRDAAAQQGLRDLDGIVLAEQADCLIFNPSFTLQNPFIFNTFTLQKVEDPIFYPSKPVHLQNTPFYPSKPFHLQHTPFF